MYSPAPYDPAHDTPHVVPVSEANVRSRTVVAIVLAIAPIVILIGGGCNSLDGRASNRKANRLFRETHFIDAAALYENALAKVHDDKIDYNLGLAYLKIYKPGRDDLVLLAEKGDGICSAIPGTTTTGKRVCVKNDVDLEDRVYASCDDKAICPSSATCKQIELCAIDNKELANLSTQHLETWIAKQAPDEQIAKQVAELSAELAKIQDARDKADADVIQFCDRDADGKFLHLEQCEDANRRLKDLDDQRSKQTEEIDETRLKFTMRAQMTNLWLQSLQYGKALEYWTAEQKAHPNDFEAMKKVAYINLQAGDWRKSIEWYLTVATKAPDTANKVSMYDSVGNLAWSKLNSKTLSPTESVELADLGIGALQKAHDLAPKNLSFLRVQGALFGFRSLAHGVSWAAAIDRASHEDLKELLGVSSGQAKPPAAGSGQPPASHDKPAPKPGG